VAFAAVRTPVGECWSLSPEDGVAAVDFRDSAQARDRMAARLRLSLVEDSARTGPVRTELAAYFAQACRTPRKILVDAKATQGNPHRAAAV